MVFELLILLSLIPLDLVRFTRVHPDLATFRANLETQIPLGSLTLFMVKNPWGNNLNNYLVLRGGVFHPWVCLSCFQISPWGSSKMTQHVIPAGNILRWQ